MFENVQISDEQDDFQIFQETGMPTSLSNVERRHSRFLENYENHCAAEHKHFRTYAFKSRRHVSHHFIYFLEKVC